MTTQPEIDARMAAAESEKFSESMRREAETVRALGMGDAARGTWGDMRGKALGAQMQHSTRAGFFQTFSKTFRMFLQSAILALGAWLAVQQEISPGVMIAASILMGRALAPVDQAIANWRVFIRAKRGARALQEFFAVTPVSDQKTALPEPKPKLLTAPHWINGAILSLDVALGTCLRMLASLPEPSRRISPGCRLT